MNCPRCNINLQMTEKKGIEIDYCPECRGIWLDRGELEKLIERSREEEYEKEYSDDLKKKEYNHHHDHDEDDYNHYSYQKKNGSYNKRRKGFFSELFDF